MVLESYTCYIIPQNRAEVVRIVWIAPILPGASGRPRARRRGRQAAGMA